MTDILLLYTYQLIYTPSYRDSQNRTQDKVVYNQVDS